MSLNIKIVFKDEIHRLSNLPKTYAELQAYCTSVFKFSDFCITYTDEEGDLITIACDSDLLTAYASAESLGIRNLKFILALHSSEIPRPVSEEKKCCEPSDCCEPKDYCEPKDCCEPKDFCEPKDCSMSFDCCESNDCCESENCYEPENCCENSTSQKYVWSRYTCDGCDTKPIVGNRFHCTVCEDFDFCENCEKNNQHGHPFKRTFLTVARASCP